MVMLATAMLHLLFFARQFPKEIIEKIAYVMANPVAAGLVQKASDWPGITTRPAELGRASRTAARPGYYFDAHNPNWPALACLQFSMPPALDAPADDVRLAVADELCRLERAAAAEVHA